MISLRDFNLTNIKKLSTPKCLFSVLLLLDEPTADLDPLATYLIVSMLSSHARRRGRIVVLTMEKPRSDVFPFLDRAAYLCLGDLVYAGPTRLMLEYFRTIGFPCPQLENPLMYYCEQQSLHIAYMICKHVANKQTLLILCQILY